MIPKVLSIQLILCAATLLCMSSETTALRTKGSPCTMIFFANSESGCKYISSGKPCVWTCKRGYKPNVSPASVICDDGKYSVKPQCIDDPATKTSLQKTWSAFTGAVGAGVSKVGRSADQLADQSSQKLNTYSSRAKSSLDDTQSQIEAGIAKLSNQTSLAYQSAKESAATQIDKLGDAASGAQRSASNAWGKLNDKFAEAGRKSQDYLNKALDKMTAKLNAQASTWSADDAKEYNDLVIKADEAILETAVTDGTEGYQAILSSPGMDPAEMNQKLLDLAAADRAAASQMSDVLRDSRTVLIRKICEANPGLEACAAVTLEDPSAAD